jgi:hypothetical protein
MSSTANPVRKFCSKIVTKRQKRKNIAIENDEEGCLKYEEK